MNNLQNFNKGFFKENAVFVQLLGMCPTLGVTTTAFNGLGMGLATTFVLLMSNIAAGAVALFKEREWFIASPFLVAPLLVVELMVFTEAPTELIIYPLVELPVHTAPCWFIVAATVVTALPVDGIIVFVFVTVALTESEATFVNVAA